MKSISFLFSLVILLAGMQDLPAQKLIDPQKRNEEVFLARTKQFSEFIDRFNMKTDFRGDAADSAFLSKIPREKMLSMLFDMKDPRAVIGRKKSFIEEIVRKDLKIDRFSPDIIAEARTHITYKGQPATVSLFLNQEVSGNGGVKWVLLYAGGTIFNLFSADTSMVRFIPPTSNETDFINLGRAFEDTDHLPDYASSGFRPDHLSTFFFCIRTGLIRFEYVEKVVYHILAIPGWYLRVEDFNRNDFNSGWLISDLSENALDRNEFLKNL